MSNQFSIIHVISSFKVGGAERFVVELGQSQIAQGARVLVFGTSAEDGPLKREISDLGIPCMGLLGGRIADFRAMLKWMDGTVASKAPAILHIHSPAALRYCLPFLLWFRVRGVRVVYTRHGIAPLERTIWGVIHALAKPFIRRVTFVSEAGKSIYAKRFGWKDEYLQVIPNGVSVPEGFRRVGVDPRLTVVSVGRMVTLKGQRYLLEAVSSLSTEEQARLELNFFGDGPERANLESLASRLELSAICQFHGMQLNREIIYGSADLQVVCSEQEGLSIAIMESMARGIPAIATDVGDSSKLVIHGKTGYLYTYSDVEGLTEMIKALLTDRDELSQLGAAARTHISASYSIAATAEAYRRVYL